jgi:hypothetical protein
MGLIMCNKHAALGALQLCNAVLESIREAGKQGAPEGPMYLAFQQFGMSLDLFNRILNLLVEAGRIERRNHCCFYKEVSHANRG